MMRMRFSLWLFLTLVVLLNACGVRPYDYLVPVRETLSEAIGMGQSTSETPVLMPSFTPWPLTTLTPTPSAVREKLTTPTVTTTITATQEIPGGSLEGTAVVLLGNRSGFNVFVTLKGNRQYAFAVPAGEDLAVEITPGEYEYWIIVEGRYSLHGNKAFFSGQSEWTFYRTPSVVDSPTPRWPGQGTK